MNPEPIKTQERPTPILERQLTRNLTVIALLAGFIGFGIVFGYVQINGGHLWVLPLAGVLAAGLLALDSLQPADSIFSRLDSVPGNRAWAFFGLPLLAIAVTSGSRLWGYFQGDDFGYLHYYHVLSWQNVISTFHTDLAQLLAGVPNGELRPIYGLFFMTNYELWGLHPAGYFSVCLLLHAANCLLISQIVKEMAPGQAWRGHVAALTFAVLPLHSEVFIWVTGAPSELLPALSYLSAFLAFTRYRAKGSRFYALTCLAAFVACLLTKESAITLPVMLISYDVWRKLDAARFGAKEQQGYPKGRWSDLVGVHAALGALVAVYLLWRRLVLHSYLNGGRWSSHWQGSSSALTSSPLTFKQQIAAAFHFFGQLQVFHVQNLFSFSPLLSGIVAAIAIYWGVSFWNQRNNCRPSFGPILFFGVFWYCVTTLPLLVVDPCVYHLYLPAAGLCIALAFLLFPLRNGVKPRAEILSAITYAVVIILSAWRLGSANAASLRTDSRASVQLREIRAVLRQAPEQTLAILWPGSNLRVLLDTYPYPLQPPFCSIDLPGRGSVIADPALSAVIRARWLDTRQALERRLDFPGSLSVEITVVSWDDQSHSLQVKTRAVPKQLVRARLGQVLENWTEASGITQAEFENLARGLAGLVINGG